MIPDKLVGMFFMKLFRTIAATLFFLTCTTLPLYAQWLPQNMGVDSSFRIEYLLGKQTLGNDDGKVLTWNPTPLPNPTEQLRIDFINSQLVIDGMVELTPFPAVSSRLRGNVSVAGSERNITLGRGPAPGTELSALIKPQYWSWEAAGLYNLCSGGGYRYSFVAGYRQESWSYIANTQGDNSYLRDDFVSQIPFIGLQTAMFSPSWKARFELLGSPFMTKKITHTARDQGYYMQLDGNMTNGGFIEFQVEGNIPVTRNTWLGIYTQLTYEGLKGELTGVSVDGNGASTYVPTPYNFYTLKGIWTIGLNCNVLF